jgi:hypothetical protein
MSGSCSVFRIAFAAQMLGAAMASYMPVKEVFVVDMIWCI